MALISPQDLINYTENPKVRVREPSKLLYDIINAEVKLKKLTNNEFTTPPPDEVKLFLLIYSEYYARKAIESSREGLESETFDDYTYNVGDIKEPEVSHLIDKHIISTKGVKMTLRRF